MNETIVNCDRCGFCLRAGIDEVVQEDGRFLCLDCHEELNGRPPFSLCHDSPLALWLAHGCEVEVQLVTEGMGQDSPGVVYFVT